MTIIDIKFNEEMDSNPTSMISCVVTGTRAYGPHNEKSDIDVVMMFEEAMKLRDWLIDKDIDIVYRIEDYERPSFYFSLNDALCLNVIVASCKSEFDKWKNATELMRVHGPIEGRDKRIAVFQEFFNGKKETK